MRSVELWCLLAATGFALGVACGDGTGVKELRATIAPPVGGGISMGGGALGGSAVTTELASLVLDDVPPGKLAWIAHEFRLERDEKLDHAHEFAFVYARDGMHLLATGPESRELRAGEGAAIGAGANHRHEAESSLSVFWEIRLALPGSEAPVDDARLVFESGPLEGIPDTPMAAFVHVTVPEGGQTSIHTHPGPELIYQLAGRIEYQNAIIGSIEIGPGAVEGIPPGVPVQKRNPFEGDAQFLSWFLVDASEPFASQAGFAEPDMRGKNVALVSKGARIVGVSSTFGGGGNESAWGANNAIDGAPGTQWSTAGDGDDAWIEIELPSRTHVTSIGFWTRAMSSSAQILSFRVIADGGDVHGPFELKGAAAIHYFETDLKATRLRFEALETSGGNTGAVDIEVYGSPSN